jgi:hypothetical protein
MEVFLHLLIGGVAEARVYEAFLLAVEEGLALRGVLEREGRDLIYGRRDAAVGLLDGAHALDGFGVKTQLFQGVNLLNRGRWVNF